MDGSHFDTWTRALAGRPPSRRALLSALATAAFAGLAGLLGAGREVAAACRLVGQTCDARRRCCAGSRCAGGRCRCKEDRNFFACDGPGTRCVDVATSVQHCGGCGNPPCGPEDVCLNGGCVDHCEDGERNFGETDSDCGGGRCPKCKRGDECNENGDCETDACAVGLCRECLTDAHCAAQSLPLNLFCVNLRCVQCVDDTLCARLFPNAPFCVDNECAFCRTNADCPAERPVCTPPADPSDVRDCSDRCRRDRDCRRGQRCRDGRCVAGNEDSCANGVRDGSETDVDCGGARCPKCGVPQLCDVDSDCESGHCGMVDLGDGQGFRRRCAECFRDEHCPGNQICSRPFCDD